MSVNGGACSEGVSWQPSRKYRSVLPTGGETHKYQRRTSSTTRWSGTGCHGYSTPWSPPTQTPTSWNPLLINLEDILPLSISKRRDIEFRLCCFAAWLRRADPPLASGTIAGYVGHVRSRHSLALDGRHGFRRTGGQHEALVADAARPEEAAPPSQAQEEEVSHPPDPEVVLGKLRPCALGVRGFVRVHSRSPRHGVLILPTLSPVGADEHFATVPGHC
jgi:hypothetical protein